MVLHPYQCQRNLWSCSSRSDGIVDRTELISGPPSDLLCGQLSQESKDREKRLGAVLKYEDEDLYMKNEANIR
jgi:hypothetical protein